MTEVQNRTTTSVRTAPQGSRYEGKSIYDCQQGWKTPTNTPKVRAKQAKAAKWQAKHGLVKQVHNGHLI